jgi:hypothetical protein
VPGGVRLDVRHDAGGTHALLGVCIDALGAARIARGGEWLAP